MNHYVYLLSFDNGKLYVGARSTNILPEDDVCYLGSGKALPDRNRYTCSKTILSQHATRKEAIQAEIDYIIENNCVKSDKYYNLRKSTHDKHGVTAKDCEGTARTTEKIAGRSKETHKYLRDKGVRFRQYTGENRTPAQKKADQRLRETTKGIKNIKKSNPGVSNGAFIPWYYIDPEGNYVEVYSITKSDFAKSIGVSPRQLFYRFHPINIGKCAKSSALKGWTFGNISDDASTDKD